MTPNYKKNSIFKKVTTFQKNNCRHLNGSPCTYNTYIYLRTSPLRGPIVQLLPVKYLTTPARPII